jgi:hypothetical protein
METVASDQRIMSLKNDDDSCGKERRASRFMFAGLFRFLFLPSVCLAVLNPAVGSERDVAYQDIYFGEPLKEAWEKMKEIVGAVYVGGNRIGQGPAREEPIKESSGFYDLWFRSSEEREAWKREKHMILQKFIIGNISSVTAFRYNDIYVTAYLGKKPNSSGVSGILAMTVEYRKVPADALEKGFKEKYPNAVVDEYYEKDDDVPHGLDAGVVRRRLKYVNNGCVYRLSLKPVFKCRSDPSTLSDQQKRWILTGSGAGENVVEAIKVWENRNNSRYISSSLTVYSDKYIEGYRKDYEAELVKYLDEQKKQKDNTVRF